MRLSRSDTSGSVTSAAVAVVTTWRVGGVTARIAGVSLCRGLFEAVDVGANVLGVGVVEVVQDRQRVFPAVARRIEGAGGVVALAEALEGSGFVVAVTEDPEHL